MRKCLLIDPGADAENDRAPAFERKPVRVKFAQSRNEIGLAVEIDPVFFFAAFDAIDSDNTTASGFGGDVARLSPSQRFFEHADAFRLGRGFQNKTA